MDDAQELSYTNWRHMEFEWRQAQTGWQDSTTSYFTGRFWNPLEFEMKDYLQALDYLMEILREAQEEARRRGD